MSDAAIKLMTKYVDADTPDVFLQYALGEKSLTQSRIETKCVSYGLHTSSWEYMWEALHGALEELSELSMSANYNKEHIFRLDDDWVWLNKKAWPFKFHNSWEGTDWAVSNKVTTSAILLNLQCNPVRVARFIKALKGIAVWLIRQGTPPDLVFPYERDKQKAYESLANPIIMKRLAE